MAAVMWSQASAQYEVEVLHSAGLPRPFGWRRGMASRWGTRTHFLSGRAMPCCGREPPRASSTFIRRAGALRTPWLRPVGRQVGWRERHTGDVGQFATMWSGTSESWVNCTIRNIWRRWPGNRRRYSSRFRSYAAVRVPDRSAHVAQQGRVHRGASSGRVRREQGVRHRRQAAGWERERYR